MKNKSPYISTTRMLMAIKFGRIVTYFERLLAIQSFYAFITWFYKVTWQTKIIYPQPLVPMKVSQLKKVRNLQRKKFQMHILDSIIEVPVSQKWASEFKLRNANSNFIQLLVILPASSNAWFKPLLSITFPITLSTQKTTWSSPFKTESYFWYKPSPTTE